MMDSIVSVNQVNQVNKSRSATDFGRNTTGEQKELAQGEVVVAKVVEKEGDSVILDIGGKLIRARQEGSIDFFVGMTAEFEVLQSDDAVIILKTHHADLSEVEAKLSNLIKKEISDLGLELNSKNIKILLAMHGNKIPISLKNVQELNAQINALKLDIFSMEKNLNLLGKLVEFMSEDTVDTVQTSQTQHFAPKEILFQGNIRQILDFVSSHTFAPEEIGKILTSASDASQQAQLAELLKNGEVNLQQIKSFFSQKGLEEISFSKLNTLVHSSVETLVDNVAFLKTANLEPNLLHYSLIQDLNKGESGFLNRADQYISQHLETFDYDIEKFLEFVYGEKEVKDSEQLQTQHKQMLKSMIKLFVNPDSNQNVRDALVQKLSDFLSLSKNIEEFSQSSLARTDDKFVTIKALSQIMNDNQNFLGMIIPDFLRDGSTEIELYVNKESLNSKDKDSTVVYLALNTHHLDNVRVRIEYRPTGLGIDIMCRSDEVKKLFEKQLSNLKQNIAKIYHKGIKINVYKISEDMSFGQIHKKENLVKLTGFGIDARV